MVTTKKLCRRLRKCSRNKRIFCAQRYFFSNIVRETAWPVQRNDTRAHPDTGAWRFLVQPEMARHPTPTFRPNLKWPESAFYHSDDVEIPTLPQSETVCSGSKQIVGGVWRSAVECRVPNTSLFLSIKRLNDNEKKVLKSSYQFPVWHVPCCRLWKLWHFCGLEDATKVPWYYRTFTPSHRRTTPPCRPCRFVTGRCTNVSVMMFIQFQFVENTCTNIIDFTNTKHVCAQNIESVCQNCTVPCLLSEVFIHLLTDATVHARHLTHKAQIFVAGFCQVFWRKFCGELSDQLIALYWQNILWLRLIGAVKVMFQDKYPAQTSVKWMVITDSKKHDLMFTYEVCLVSSFVGVWFQ